MSLQGSDRGPAPPGDDATRPHAHRAPGLLGRINPAKIAIVIISLLLFTLSLQLIKAGAASAGPLVRDTFNVTSPLSALGFGWLLSYVVLSGSPVAAIGLVLLSEEAITNVEAFMMVGGSRLGAGLIVLMLGFYYMLRGADRETSLSVGLLSLAVTASVQAPALALGYLALEAGFLADIQFSFGAIDYLDRLYDPLVNALSDRLPDLAVMVVGIVLIVVTFSLFDRGLPEVGLGERGFGATPLLVYRPSIMFALGLVVTLLTLSVSVSVGILVPLTARGLIRRENLIPYIMGANVSTLIDTLVVAFLLDSSEGVTVVLVGMLSITVVSLAVLLAGYQYYERGVAGVVDWTLARQHNLVIVLAILFLVPMVLVFL